MSIGKRTFKKVTFDRSEGDTVTKSIVCPEGGWVGYFSVWHRRVEGTANAVLRVYASFNADATEDEKLELTYGNVYDTLDTFLWGWYAEFPSYTSRWSSPTVRNHHRRPKTPKKKYHLFYRNPQPLNSTSSLTRRADAIST